MSMAQRLVRSILPRSWADSIESESRAWIMTCSECSATQSVWDAGGIRWKAKGTPSVRASCAACGKTTTQRVAREE